MKLTFLLIGLLVSGCATSYRVDPSRISFQISPSSVSCGAHDREIPVVLAVRNESRGVLKIGVEGKVGPPFAISWLYYEIKDKKGVTDVAHGPGGHGPMPPSTLRIGPGDSTSVSASLYEISAADYSRQFQIQLEDLDGHTYTTASFYPCVKAAHGQ